jgi:hypothetical protein
MGTLIPNIQLKDFQTLSIEQLKRLKSCTVVDGEEYLFVFTRPNTDYCKARAEDTAYLSNLVGGEELVQVMGVMPSVAPHSEPELYVSDKPYIPKKAKKKKRKVKV